MPSSRRRALSYSVTPSRTLRECRSASVELARRHRAGAERPRPAAALQPALVVHEAEESGADAEEEEDAVPEHGRHAAAAVVELPERRGGGLERVREDVPEKEQEDADGDGVQQLPQARARAAQASHRKAQEDGGAGHEPQDQGLDLTHRLDLHTSRPGSCCLPSGR